MATMPSHPKWPALLEALTGMGGVDPKGLATLATDKVCSLLSKDEAVTVLGGALDKTPSGMNIKGLGTNCLYDSGPKEIKIEFNTLSYSDEVELLKMSGPVQTLTVAGRQSTASVSGGIAMLAVPTTDDPKSAFMYVEAPTLDGVTKVGELVYPRVTALK